MVGPEGRARLVLAQRAESVLLEETLVTRCALRLPGTSTPRRLVYAIVQCDGLVNECASAVSRKTRDSRKRPATLGERSVSPGDAVGSSASMQNARHRHHRLRRLRARRPLCATPATTCAASPATPPRRAWTVDEVVEGDALTGAGLDAALGRRRGRLLPDPLHGGARPTVASTPRSCARPSTSRRPRPAPACAGSSTSAGRSRSDGEPISRHLGSRLAVEEIAAGGRPELDRLPRLDRPRRPARARFCSSCG